MDANHLYIAYIYSYSDYTNSVDRYPLDGTSETHIYDTVELVRALMVVNQFLILQNRILLGNSEYFQSIDKVSGAVISKINNPNGILSIFQFRLQPAKYLV